MDKLLLFSGKSDRGIFTYVLDTEHTHLVKTAAQYHPEIANYINSAKKIPGKTQILLTALGAGEYWGCNVNGDYFPEMALSHFGEDYGYKTFEYNAKIYKHHINKDPKASYGHVALAVYNPQYHRVELIVILDNSSAPEIVERIENGDYPEWSMGCRVPYDVCSVCGNKARTRKEYCDHLKYYMGRIDPGSGKQAYAINTTPKFFDISQVLIGADKIAKTLRKVASTGTGPVISSALLAEKMAETKVSSIDKEIPADAPPASQESIDTLVRAIPEVKAYEAPLPKPVLDRLGSAGLNEALSTLSFLGILPKPQEFQRIFLVSVGKKDVADQLDSHNMCFDPGMCEQPNPKHMGMINISPDLFRNDFVGMLSPHIEQRSYFNPFLVKRIIMIEKNANVLPQYLPNFIKVADRKPVGLMPMLGLAAVLYSVLSSKGGPEVSGKIDQLIAKHPALAASLALGGAMIFNKVTGPSNVGQDSGQSTANADTIDVAKRIEEMRQKPLTKTAALIGAAGKRLLGVPLAYMASGQLQKQRQMDPYAQEGKVKSFIRQYPDVIASGLVIDALAGHRGTHGIFSKAAPHAETVAKKLRSALDAIGNTPHLKTANAQDFVTNSLIWPLVSGGSNLPAKIVGGLFDQAVFETSKKLLSNKKQGNRITK